MQPINAILVPTDFMGTIARRGVKALLLALATGASLSAQSPAVPSLAQQTSSTIQEQFATQLFQERVTEYVTLHRLLEGPLPPLRPTTNMAEIQSNMRLLASRILLARQTAQTGDIITPDVARMLRRRVATCLSPEAWEAVLAELAEDEEGVPVPAVRLHVNMEWPEQVPFGFVPPQLLSALPPLPPELQYRIIGRSLVLWDHHANLIVDFLPAAFST